MHKWITGKLGVGLPGSKSLKSMGIPMDHLPPLWNSLDTLGRLLLTRQAARPKQDYPWWSLQEIHTSHLENPACQAMLEDGFLCWAIHGGEGWTCCCSNCTGTATTHRTAVVTLIPAHSVLVVPQQQGMGGSPYRMKWRKATRESTYLGDTDEWPSHLVEIKQNYWLN